MSAPNSCRPGEEEVELQQLAQPQRLRLGARRRRHPSRSRRPPAARARRSPGRRRRGSRCCGRTPPPGAGRARSATPSRCRRRRPSSTPDATSSCSVRRRSRRVLEVERTSDPPAALGQVVRDRRDRLLHLRQRERAVLAEDRHADDGGRGHRRRAVDPVARLEGDPLDGVRRRGLVRPQLGHPLASARSARRSRRRRDRGGAAARARTGRASAGPRVASAHPWPPMVIIDTSCSWS